ncbi:hypothetical protein GCM10023080_083940 [Streptomyces pseudoechinosporeus]
MYRFKPGIDNAFPDGREVPLVPVELGGWLKYALEESLAHNLGRACSDLSVIDHAVDGPPPRPWR